jgi:formylglycine-generating enzyme required for sulfatase activity
MREEWEAASRGAEPKVYPWGDIFQPAFCNNGSTEWGRTVDVREYPDGDSPYGCRQMTGNVFEWLGDCEGNARFMRGGSYLSACEVYGMTFFEIQTSSGYKSADTGFRVVRQHK